MTGLRMSKLVQAWRDRSGTSLVETAIVLPFVLVLGFGVIEYGNALYLNHQIETGVRDAARYLARHEDPLAMVAEAKQLALTGSITGGDKRVSAWDGGDITVSLREIANPVDPTTGERPYRGGDPIKVVRVSTNVSYEGLGGLNMLGSTSVLNFSVSHEERVIGE
jgi:hypothetical protein